jgi:AraC-like DNA-binding protein
MKRASQLLKDRELNVSEVAYQVGYNSPHFFTVQFKKEFGVTPSNYQEKVNG